MKITLICPAIGKKEKDKYVKTWQMQPLAIAVLKGLTPDEHEVRFYDDRFEDIPFNEPTDLVGITVETFTAKRSYEICARFRARGVKVVLGGYHPTFMTEEALENCDSVVVGEAENVWPKLLDDFQEDNLQKIYKSEKEAFLDEIKIDRSIFAGKNYFDIALIETGRGCKYLCDFCSITEFYGAKYRRRPTSEIVKEIQSLKTKNFFFVDDNVTSDHDSAIKLFNDLKPLGIKWVSQASIDIANNEELLDVMRDSGCLGVLIGFESLSKKNLVQMSKNQNTATDYKAALQKIRDKGIIVYGAFVIGYDDDDLNTLKETLEFGIENKLFLIAFNHLTPFPGTPVYDRIKKEGRMRYEKWWLNSGYHFGDVPFEPKSISAQELRQLCYEARKKFYSVTSILKRSSDLKANTRNITMAKIFFVLNFLLRKEVNQKDNILLGNSPD